MVGWVGGWLVGWVGEKDELGLQVWSRGGVCGVVCKKGVNQMRTSSSCTKLSVSVRITAVLCYSTPSWYGMAIMAAGVNGC